MEPSKDASLRFEPSIGSYAPTQRSESTFTSAWSAQGTSPVPQCRSWETSLKKGFQFRSHGTILESTSQAHSTCELTLTPQWSPQRKGLPPKRGYRECVRQGKPTWRSLCASLQRQYTLKPWGPHHSIVHCRLHPVCVSKKEAAVDVFRQWDEFRGLTKRDGRATSRPHKENRQQSTRRVRGEGSRMGPHPTPSPAFWRIVGGSCEVSQASPQESDGCKRSDIRRAFNHLLPSGSHHEFTPACSPLNRWHRLYGTDPTNAPDRVWSWVSTHWLSTWTTNNRTSKASTQLPSKTMEVHEQADRTLVVKMGFRVPSDSATSCEMAEWKPRRMKKGWSGIGSRG